MRREGLRRLELWLPVNHPIWSYPDGTRARVAASMLDLGLALEARLARIEERLARLEERGVPAEPREEEGRRRLDPAAFLAAFD